MSTVLMSRADHIGSDFVRYWRTVHPGDRMVAPDALTQAGMRKPLDGPDGQPLDSAVLRTEFGRAPAEEWNDGIADIVARYAACEAWWRPRLRRGAVLEGAGANRCAA